MRPRHHSPQRPLRHISISNNVNCLKKTRKVCKAPELLARMSAVTPSPMRGARVVPQKPLPPPPARVAALSGRDAVHGNPAALQRGAKAHSADGDSQGLVNAREEALKLHQRTGSEQSPRTFILAPVRSESSPDMRSPKGGSHRAAMKDLTPEEQEQELFDALIRTLQNEEGIAHMDARLMEASLKQGHQGRVRSGTVCFVWFWSSV